MSTILGGKFKYKTGCKDVVICSECSKEFKYHHSTSSLAYHFKNSHFTKTKTAAAPVPSSSSTNSKKEELVQSTLDQCDFTKLSRAKVLNITNALALWVAKNMRPIAITEDSGLQNLLRVATGNSSFTLPARGTIKSKIDSMFQELKADIKSDISQVSHVGLTCDYWTSMANENYLGLTCHYIDTNFNLKSTVLDVSYSDERHTADNISDHLTTLTEGWGIVDKVVAVVTDNARNMINAIEKMPYIHLNCAAHTLQLSVNKALTAANVDAVLAKVRKIVGHVRHSPANYVELKALQEEHGETQENLIPDVAVRWNSTFMMIQRLLKHKVSVQQFLVGRNLQALTAMEWDKLRTLECLLEPCAESTQLLGGEKYVSSSIVLPHLAHLIHLNKANDDDPAYVSRFKQALRDDLKSRLVTMTKEMYLKVATALDPRHKSLKCLPADQRDGVWAHITNLVKLELQQDKEQAQDKTQPVTKKSKFSYEEESGDENDEEAEEVTPANGSLYDKARALVEVYRATSFNYDQELSHPLEWWQANCFTHKVLGKLVRQYLCCPGTSVPSERLFSKAGNVISKKRCSLKPDNANMLISMSNWLK